MTATSNENVHQVMSFDDAVSARRSVRGFKPDPVTPELLDHLFGLANKAPSNCNTQPWRAVVCGGQRRDQVRDRILQAVKNGEMSLDFPFDGKYDGVYKERQYDAAFRLYGAMDVAREDRAGRDAVFMRNYELFDAPHVAFLFLPEWSGMREACDLGMYAQTLMLAMTAHGLASCPQTSLGFFCDLLRDEFDIDPSWKLMFGLSFGYPDHAHKANNCVTPRADLSEVVAFYN